MLLKKIRENAFLFVAFALGWASLYGNVLNFLLIVLLIVNVWGNGAEFWRNIKREKYYLGVPAFFLIYMGFHALFYRVGAESGFKPSYGIFETLLLYFILVPLYLLSLKPYLTVKLLEKALLCFCGGVLLVNACMFFELTGWGFFKHPMASLEFIYQSRFGGNRHPLGGDLMLEPQAMVLSLASVLAFFMTLIRKKFWIGAMAFFLILCLSFTVTKASLLGFVIGAFIGGWYLFRKLKKREKGIVIVSLAVLLLAGILYMPEGYVMRFHETATEIKNIGDGRMQGGSLAPRIVMWMNAKEHFSEYALWGVGMYYKPMLKQWYAESPLISSMPNVHNSFLEYWIKGGLFGLALIVSQFAFPLVRMFRRKQWSLIALGGIAAIFIASNTCVLFVHNNSLTIILFWLSAFYFYPKAFTGLEQEP